VEQLYEREFPQTRHGGDRKSSAQNGQLKVDRYTKDAAKKTGVSDQTVRREVARGAIPNVIALVGYRVKGRGAPGLPAAIGL
jgi:hypothetical protein